MRLEQAERGDYQALIALWEASVRATHHFLPDEEIATLRELILAHYFDAVTLTCARNDQGIAGFYLISFFYTEFKNACRDFSGHTVFVCFSLSLNNFGTFAQCEETYQRHDCNDCRQ